MPVADRHVVLHPEKKLCRPGRLRSSTVQFGYCTFNNIAQKLKVQVVRIDHLLHSFSKQIVFAVHDDHGNQRSQRTRRGLLVFAPASPEALDRDGLWLAG